VDRLCDEFLASTGFLPGSTQSNRRRDAFDLFEYYVQRKTIAYDLLKSGARKNPYHPSGIIPVAATRPTSCPTHASYWAQRSRAARHFRQGFTSNGFAMNSTGLLLGPHPHFSSPCAVMKMVGILH